ncbi:CLUMA_CG014140, isoform A [Clunio marinus]|uniref:CLUMA_CG014140, isoform A n=1 Tax=Clunio marinus TaxID=568069 RepID=A0A1J1IQX8_9DIPT|nr:CLUMA_CG014140, isoform A [Clunio marinus]
MAININIKEVDLEMTEELFKSAQLSIEIKSSDSREKSMETMTFENKNAFCGRKSRLKSSQSG